MAASGDRLAGRVAIGHEPRPEMARLASSLVAELIGGGGKAVAVPADLAEVDQVDVLIATAHDALGPIDIRPPARIRSAAHTSAVSLARRARHRPGSST